MATLLHTADWQIGRAYTTLPPDDAVPLAEARYAAVERIAHLARQHAVDAVVVAGDVFDAQTVSARSIRRLFNALAAFDGPWVMIPGNHDAALADSVWAHAQRLGAVPPQVHLVLSPQVLTLPDAGIALLCAPLTQRHAYGDLTDWFDSAHTPDGWLRVGVAHGGVQGLLAEGAASTNPIAPDRAARARLDYLALGDWHGTRRIDDRTWYSGTPEPDRFRDNDAGQALLVALDAPGALPRVQPLRTGQHRWRQWQQVLQVPSDVDGLLARLADADASDVLDLTLTGQVDLAGHQRVLQALSQLEGRVRCLQHDLSGLQLAPTDDDIASLQADGYLGTLIAELRDTTGDDARCAQDALAILTGLLADRPTAGSASSANPSALAPTDTTRR